MPSTIIMMVCAASLLGFAGAIRGWNVRTSTDWNGDHCCSDGPDVFNHASRLNETHFNVADGIQYYNGCEGWRCQCQSHGDSWMIADLTDIAKINLGKTLKVTCNVTSADLASGGVCFPANASVQVLAASRAPSGVWPAPYHGNCSSNLNTSACTEEQIAATYNCLFGNATSTQLPICSVTVPIQDPQDLGGAFLVTARAPVQCLSDFCIYGGSGSFGMTCKFEVSP